MRLDLWPDEGLPSLTQGMDEWLDSAEGAVFVAEDSAGKLIGFVEAAQRTYAEGAETSPVGYVEGWYVAPDARQRSVGGALLQAAENWAKKRGLTEMASDTWLHNELSIAAHKRLGYQEKERIVCFLKVL